MLDIRVKFPPRMANYLKRKKKRLGLKNYPQIVKLRATKLGLVTHPIAGYDEEQVKKVLNIPEDMRVIT
ncbi:MAG: hypothetical protein ACETWM_12570 [Candidatus Lokiarchaeia archaeon]